MGKGEKIFWDFYARRYDTLGSMIPYDQLHKEIARYVARGHTGVVHVLDAGCGTGHQLKLLRKRHPDWDLIGVDRSKAMLKIAEKKLYDSDVVIEHADLSKPLPYYPNVFDAVISTNVLYTLPEPEQHIRDIRRILKKDGTLVLVNPWDPKPQLIFFEHFQRVFQRRRPEEVLLTCANLGSYAAILALNFMIAAKAKQQSYYFARANDLAKILERNGFKICTLRDDIYSNTCVLIHAQAN